MARRRTKRKVSFDSKIVIDVGLAGLATRLIPQVVNKFMPLDPTLYSVIGAGGTYLAGTLLKKEVLANAGIALGLVELVSPMVEEIIGGFGSPATLPMGVKASPTPIAIKGAPALNDPMYLADYTNSPAVQSYNDYSGSY